MFSPPSHWQVINTYTVEPRLDCADPTVGALAAGAPWQSLCHAVTQWPWCHAAGAWHADAAVNAWRHVTRSQHSHVNWSEIRQRLERERVWTWGGDPAVTIGGGGQRADSWSRGHGGSGAMRTPEAAPSPAWREESGINVSRWWWDLFSGTQTAAQLTGLNKSNNICKWQKQKQICSPQDWSWPH